MKSNRIAWDTKTAMNLRLNGHEPGIVAVMRNGVFFGVIGIMPYGYEAEAYASGTGSTHALARGEG